MSGAEDWLPAAWDDSDLADVVPAIRCLCSHKQHPNGQCWSRACGCRENRPQEKP